MLNQLGSGLGIAAAALSLRVGSLLHPNSRAVTAHDFQFAFWVVAVLGMLSYLDFRRLAPDAADALRKRAASS
jgi:hypothetical protein